MRKFIWLFITASALPFLADNHAANAAIPPDSEMVYRANLGRADDIELLLQQGGDIRAVNNNGVGLLFLAAGRKDPEGVNVVHALLANGLDINSRDDQGRTALFYAAKGGNPEIVQYLLDNGVDAYTTDNSGDVARNYAYRAGNLDTVELMDNFARQKVAEVNSAYERINRELQQRYKELEERQKKTLKETTEANKKNAAAAAPTLPVPTNTEPKAIPAVTVPIATAVPPATTQADTKPVPIPVAPAPKPATPEQVYAEEIVSSIDDTMKDIRRKKQLEAKIAQEERQTKLEEAKELARQQQEKEQAEEDAKRSAEREAADQLKQKLYDAQMEAYMRAEIEAEAAELRIQQQKEALEDTETRKAKMAEMQRRNDERDNVFRDLAYNNCVFQYWYYCYTSDLTTELQSEDLRNAIETSKTKVADIQDTLLHDYKVSANTIRKISHSAKKRVFSQLDVMKSSRQRRSEGVGNVVDMESRCNDISLNWDVMPGSVVTERKRVTYDADDNKNLISIPTRPQPFTGRSGGR